MNFLLVTTIKREIVKVWVCQETSSVGSILPPVDLCSLAAMIKKEGHYAKIFDLRFYREPLLVYKEEIETSKYDAVIANVSTASALYDYEILSNTPKEIVKIVFGTHPQSVPEECFEKGADYILIGDPEAGITNLLKNNLNGEASTGVLTKNDSGTKNKLPLFLENLDSLPFPALDLLDLRKYRAPYIRRSNLFTLLLGSRGCPFLCTYCLYPVMFGRKLRVRTVKNIVDEMEEDYKKLGIKEFYFLDGTFNISKERVEDFCEEILRSGLNINWQCNMRVTPVSTEMLKLMKRAGCNRIFYGVEDQDFLQETKKGITKESTIEAFHKTKEIGISTVAFIMLFPREDINEKKYIQNILWVLKTLKADAFQCNIAIPFPGTSMYAEYKNRNDLLENWSACDPQGDKMPYKSNFDLVKVKKCVYRKFLLRNPLTVFKIAMQVNFRTLSLMIGTFLKKNYLKM